MVVSAAVRDAAGSLPSGAAVSDGELNGGVALGLGVEDVPQPASAPTASVAMAVRTGSMIPTACINNASARNRWRAQGV